MTKSVLIIEDDKNLQQYLKELLIDNHYTVESLNDGTSALDIIERIRPDLIILDLGLPMVKGESVLIQVKKEFPNLPIIILTGKDSLNDKINAFDIGADDYITKPFSSEELLVRIKARLREAQSSNNVLKAADLQLDTDSMEVKRGSKEINLTPQEYKLLEYLLANKGRILSREALLNKIWANSLDIETRVVDVYISYLRNKIDSHSKKKLIKSVRGFGYTIKE